MTPVHFGFTRPVFKRQIRAQDNSVEAALTAGKKMERKGLLDVVGTNGCDYRVTRVISSSTASADIGFASKHVYEFSLALVTPLGAEHDGHCTDQHKFSTPNIPAR